MRHNGTIWLGDYLRAVRELYADEKTAGAIAELLNVGQHPEMAGLAGYGERQDDYQQSHTGAGGHVEDVERVKFKVVPNKPAPSKYLAPPLKPGDTDATIPATLIPLPPAAVSSAAFLYADTLAEEEPAGRPLDPIPLFPSEQTRGILSRVLARRANIGPWDLPQVVLRSARGEMLSEIPRLPQPTLARGVQLLVDRGSALAVYAADQNWLQCEIEKVAGRSKVATLEFAGNPLQIFDPEDPSESQPYLDSSYMPPPGTVVAALTDLGIGRPTAMQPRSTVWQWLELARRLRLRQCPVVAFVPYAPARWPTALQRALTIIHWDWMTNTDSIHAVAGKGLAAG